MTRRSYLPNFTGYSESRIFDDRNSIERTVNDLKNDFQMQINELRNQLEEKVSRDELEDLEQSLKAPQAPSQDDDRPNLTRKILHGSDTTPTSDELDHDFFTLMMLTQLKSWTWVIGFVSFSIQITLGILTLLELTHKTLLGTTLSIPVKTENNIRIAQVLVIVVATMTQTDVLVGLRNLFLLRFKEKQLWGSIIGVNENQTFFLWSCRIFLPNFLKMMEGTLILFATFLVIVQSDDIVELLKDFSALFVISSIDDLFFMMADIGYFGRRHFKIAQKAKGIKIGTRVKSAEDKVAKQKVEKQLEFSFFVVIAGMLGTWIYITIGQENGRYFKQMYPNCNLNQTFDGTQFLSIVADDICQFKMGEGTNVVQCGWDGGDCEALNERYPDCVVPEYRLLGDGKCDGNEYNTETCGFDNGDCVKDNSKLLEKYPDCLSGEPGLVGNGFCDGGVAFTSDCDFDGGDCKGCIVDDVFLIKDGFCNGGIYASEECSNDGGDCDNCKVDDIFDVGDGFCDEGEYNSVGCSFDGGDCIPATALVGEAYDGPFKWFGAALAHNGAIYSSPYNHNFVLKFDTTTDISKLVGEELGNNVRKFSFSVLGNDGIIYGVPYFAKYILRIDPTTDTISRIAEGHELLAPDRKFGYGVSVDTGEIYFIPYNYNRVVKFNPDDIDNPLVEIGNDLGNEEEKYWAGVLANDGNIYCVPVGTERVLKINPRDDSTSYLGIGDPEAEHFYYSGTLARDGNIYACPYRGQRILQINIKDQTTNIVGPDFGVSGWCGGFIQRDDGQLYGMPAMSNHIIRFDPVLQTGTRVRLDEKVSPMDEGEGFNEGGFKWGYPSILGTNDIIYSVPMGKKKVLVTKPVQIKGKD